MSRTFSREDLNDEVLNPRLQREKAKTGEITASLLWNGPSDLDLHAKVKPSSTGREEHIFFRNKKAAGGELDIDANARDVTEEPVENIFWKKPPPGSYVITVQNYALRRASAGSKVYFRVQLKLPEETLDYEGKLGSKEIATCFKFTVDEEGATTICQLAASRVMRKPSAVFARPMKAMKVMKAMKAMKTMKAMKVKSMKVAKGKLSKTKVFKGSYQRTSGGLTKDALMKSKSGKIVTKRMHAMGKKAYVNIEKWTAACKKARAELGLTGFVAVKKGSPLYAKAKEILGA